MKFGPRKSNRFANLPEDILGSDPGIVSSSILKTFFSKAFRMVFKSPSLAFSGKVFQSSMERVHDSSSSNMVLSATQSLLSPPLALAITHPIRSLSRSLRSNRFASMRASFVALIAYLWNRSNWSKAFGGILNSL